MWRAVGDSQMLCVTIDQIESVVQINKRGGASCSSARLILPQADDSFRQNSFGQVEFEGNVALRVITEGSKTVRYLVQNPPTPGPPSRATACRPSTGIPNYQPFHQTPSENDCNEYKNSLPTHSSFMLVLCQQVRIITTFESRIHEMKPPNRPHWS